MVADQRTTPGIWWSAPKADMTTAGGHIGSHNIGGSVGGNVTVSYYYQQNGRPTCKEIVDWLRSQTIDYRKTHDNTYSARTSKTGGWFFDSAQFKDWVEGEFKNLACIGMPGAGKTSLVSAVIERLHQHSDQTQDIDNGATSQPRRLVLYIYCKHNSQSMQTVPILFSNLLSQVVQILSDEELPTYMLELYKDYKSDRGMPRLDLTMTVLKRQISQYGRTYIIFDALDEYLSGDHSELVQALESLDAQLLITSRWEVPFTSQSSVRVDDVQAKVDDIRTYIEAQIQTSRISKIVRNDPSLSAEIISKLSAKANGMFLLPKLHIEMMKSQRTPQGIRDTMEHLPEDLHSLFEESLQRILNQPCQTDVDLGIRTLKWMRYAKKFLSTDELLHALAMYSLPGMRGDFKGYLPLKEDVLAACAGLVVIVEPEEGKSEFRFTHYSIQEFLERPSSSLTYFGSSAEREITEICLQYLINITSLVGDDDQTYFITTPLPLGSGGHGEYYESQRTEKFFKNFPLSIYAGCYWADHAASIYEDFDHDLIITFFRQPLTPYMYAQQHHSGAYVGPLPSMDPEHYQILFLSRYGLYKLLSRCLRADIGAAAQTLDEIRDSEQWTALYFAAMHGYTDIVHLLLSKGASIDTPDHNGDTPLCRASGCGHFDVVELLVEKGAKVNPPSPRETPLCWAARGGHEKIVRFLLELGADVNPPTLLTNSTSRTPLHAAVENRNRDIAVLLLANGANPNPPGINHGEPLAWAAFHGDMDITQLLLDNGAYLDQPDADGKTPLHLAIWREHFDVAELLLAKGAGINSSPKYRGEPLAWAACHGNQGIVQLLLDNGADPNQPDSDDQLPLQLAIWKKHFDIAKLLLAQGAEPNSPGKNSGQPLAWASYCGERDLVQLLLDKNADPNQLDSSEQTPLQLAIGEKHFDIATLLLVKGARPNPPGVNSGQPLVWVAYYGDQDLAQLLLDKGADPNQLDAIDRAPLYMAIREKHFNIARMLLAKGACPNSPVTDGGKPLSGEPLAWAAHHGDRDLVQLLLEKEADPNRPDADEQTPLYLAIRAKHFDVAELLLAKGATPNPPGPIRGQALAWATIHGDLGVVQMLLDKGAEPNQPDTEERTPLHLSIREQHFDVAKLLLARGAVPNPPGVCRGEPLAWSSYLGDASLLQLLLDKGADIDQPGAEGQTPLLLAIRGKHFDIAELLLVRGADPNPPGRLRGEPLAWATFSGSVDTVKALLGKGADIDQPDPHGETPLQLAIRVKRRDITKLLLDGGARCKDEEEETTARQLASSINDTDMRNTKSSSTIDCSDAKLNPDPMLASSRNADAKLSSKVLRGVDGGEAEGVDSNRASIKERDLHDIDEEDTVTRNKTAPQLPHMNPGHSTPANFEIIEYVHWSRSWVMWLLSFSVWFLVEHWYYFVTE